MKYRIIIDTDRCKGCELCIGVCPRHVLKMSTDLNQTGAHFPNVLPAHDCIGCCQCAIICPDAAIEIEELAAQAQTGRRVKHRMVRKNN